jgi:NAD(P)-dependent dehydrogenase (short-subunit alcohol dehydrogenase family)
MREDAKVSRRKLVSTLGAGLAGAAIGGSAGAQEPGSSTAQPMIDPRTKYPRPPYPAQTQPWPGLASKMDPRPDHGEKTYKGSGRLLDRKALITGGDSGMGRAAAIAYAREGADVAISYFPSEEPDAREVEELVKAAGRKCLLLPGDLRHEDYCKEIVAKTVQAFGGLDILVSNAGRQHQMESILDITTELFDWTIIATASEQAYDPSPNLYDYAQTKAATMNFVKSLAKQLASKGIRVNGVAPGPIWTPLQVSGGADMKKLTSFGGNYPLERAGQPGELASIYVQLAAQDASYTTGNIYGAGGGMGQP